MYTCAECSKSYSKVYNLKQHILLTHTKSPDKPIKEKPKPKKNKVGRPKIHRCDDCKLEFCNKYSLERHVKSSICKPKITINQSASQSGGNGISESVLLKMFEMITKITDDKRNTYSNTGMVLTGNNNNMQMDNHTENNITQNNALYIREVHINPMGKESLSHISDATILQILNQGVNAVPALAKAIMELPENCNIVESDKRNKKATVVNRDGDIEIMDLNKALTMCATETVDRVDDYYEKFKDELPKQNKSIQRMARAHGLDSDEEEDDIPKDETYEAYFKKYTSQIKDNIDVNKKPILERINKYKDYKYNEKVNKSEVFSLTS
jgi:hypothetical protein